MANPILLVGFRLAGRVRKGAVVARSPPVDFFVHGGHLGTRFRHSWILRFATGQEAAAAGLEKVRR